MPSLFITGANTGLGLEFARQYTDAGWRVIATARPTADTTALAQVADMILPLEATDDATIRALPAALGAEPIDLLICNAGMMGPQWSISDAEAAGWLETLHVNTVAPLLTASILKPALLRGSGRKAIAITSGLGSIADVGSAMALPYRTSKAGLNMAWRCLASDWADDGIVCAVLNPGWVQTRMGGPNAPRSTAEAIAAMRRVIDDLGPNDTGAFLNHDGNRYPW